MTTIPQRAQAIRLVIFDVDGILSDGKLYFSASGEEIKQFYAQDGIGIKALLRNGIDVAIITGRRSAIVTHRAKELGIAHVFQEQDDKIIAFNQLKEDLQLNNQAIAYVGDDLPDLPLIQQAGLGISVPNAVRLVQTEADWITPRVGGSGAARDVCDLVLAAQGFSAQ